MHDGRHHRHSHQSPNIQPLLYQHIEGEERGDDGSSEIDGDDRPRPLLNVGNDIPYAEKNTSWPETTRSAGWSW